MRRESMVLPIVMIKKSASLKVVRCFVHRESCRRTPLSHILGF
jgi:hypothetical protein